MKTLYKKITTALRRWISILGAIWYGLTAYEFVISIKQERGHLERIFILILFGDLFGIPILPSYYSMRLFPYIIPSIKQWQHNLGRERDLTDMLKGDIG